MPVVTGAFITALLYSPVKENVGRWAKSKVFRQKYEIDSILLKMRLITGGATSFGESMQAMIEILKAECDIDEKPIFLLEQILSSVKRVFYGH